jgi:hypothetical protein
MLLVAVLPQLAAALSVPFRLAPSRATRAAVSPLMCSNDWNSNDENYLQDAINRASSTRVGEPERVLNGLGQAWVLIFNLGQHDEGVYTLQGRSAQPSSYVLAFECTDEAVRFAQLLQAEGFDMATPSCWDVEHLSTFCKAGSFEVSLVPEGSLITPPTKNEYDTEAFERLDAGYGAVDTDAQNRAADERGGGAGPATKEPKITGYSAERAALDRLFGKTDYNCDTEDECDL